MLQLMNIKKSYNVYPVLQISSLQLGNGIYWVKGVNGSGKTTLLKMIAGLLPFNGDILFKDISLKRKPLAYRQNASWAEAEPLFPEFMTGMDLLLLYRNIRKVSQDEIDKLIEFFKLSGYVNNATGTYSEGMRKKLSLALAFIGNAPLIVLDEPFITLDPDAIASVCDIVLDRHTNNRTTFLMSSHQELDKQLLLIGKELTVSNQTVSLLE
jgi:ABC-2 type transport system ATP-binding protein